MRIEIERRGAKDLATIISIVESLVDFQKRVDEEKPRQLKEKNSANDSCNTRLNSSVGIPISYENLHRNLKSQSRNV